MKLDSIYNLKNILIFERINMNHWILLCCNIPKRHVVEYNPMRNICNEDLQKLFQQLLTFSNENQKSFDCCHHNLAEQQLNCNDCGFFYCVCRIYPKASQGKL